MDLLPKFLETFLYAVDVGWYVVHDDVEFASVFGPCFTEESMLDSHYVLVVHLFVDLKLTALVLLVLLQFLDGNDQASLFKCAHVDDCECTMPAFDFI